MFGCQEGHEHVVEELLKGGATVDIQNEVIPVIITVRPPFSVRNCNCFCSQLKDTTVWQYHHDSFLCISILDGLFCIDNLVWVNFTTEALVRLYHLRMNSCVIATPHVRNTHPQTWLLPCACITKGLSNWFCPTVCLSVCLVKNFKIWI